jgi:hypothetical protein
LIFQAIEAFEKEKRELANANSFTTAVFASGVFNGFAGKDAEKCDFLDLLPFSSDTKETKVDRKLNEPTKETAKVFLELMEKQMLPARVVDQAFKAKIIDKLQAIA